MLPFIRDTIHRDLIPIPETVNVKRTACYRKAKIVKDSLVTNIDDPQRRDSDIFNQLYAKYVHIAFQTTTPTEDQMRCSLIYDVSSFFLNTLMKVSMG